MEKRIIKLFGLATIAVMCLACEKKTEEIAPTPVVTPPPACYLNKMEYTGGYTYSFRFDAKNRLAGAEMLYPKAQNFYAKQTFAVEYNDKDQAIRIVNDNFDTLNKLVYKEISTLEYDGTGKLTSYYLGSDTATRHRLSFDNNQKLVKLQYPQSFSASTIHFTYDAKGNRSRTYSETGSARAAFTLVYTQFDDKKNPFAGFGFPAYLMGFNPFTTNNVMSYTTYNEQGGEVGTESYTYTYNDKDYPVTSAYTYVDAASQTKTVQSGTNAYDCK